MWPDKWVKLNMGFCERISNMVYKAPGWIVDSCPPIDRRTL